MTSAHVLIRVGPDSGDVRPVGLLIRDEGMPRIPHGHRGDLRWGQVTIKNDRFLCADGVHMAVRAGGINRRQPMSCDGNDRHFVPEVSHY